jgi:hypothetical protein
MLPEDLASFVVGSRIFTWITVVLVGWNLRCCFVVEGNKLEGKKGHLHIPQHHILNPVTAPRMWCQMRRLRDCVGAGWSRIARCN